MQYAADGGPYAKGDASKNKHAKAIQPVEEEPFEDKGLCRHDERLDAFGRQCFIRFQRQFWSRDLLVVLLGRLGLHGQGNDAML